MRGALLLATLVTGLDGCSHTCTMIYAPSALGVEFETETWAPGTYEIEIEGYNQYAMCVVTLPQTEGDAAHCTDNVALSLSRAGDAVAHMLVLEFAPPTLVVVILDDDGLVAEERFTPDYTVDEPNGPGCGEQRVATITMSF